MMRLIRRWRACCSIYTVHDEAKDKDFELELSWVGPPSNGRHAPVPKALQEEAERKAKEGLSEDMED
jgi:20S proteasome subunit alpha 7